VHASIADFTVGPVFPDASQARGRHLYIVEFSGTAPADIDAFARSIDEQLCRANDDYRSHRSGGFGLDPPSVTVVGHGTFAAWMRSRGKLGGQHKVPRIISDPGLLAEFRQFVSAETK